MTDQERIATALEKIAVELKKIHRELEHSVNLEDYWRECLRDGILWDARKRLKEVMKNDT